MTPNKYLGISYYFKTNFLIINNCFIIYKEDTIINLKHLNCYLNNKNIKISNKNNEFKAKFNLIEYLINDYKNIIKSKQSDSITNSYKDFRREHLEIFFSSKKLNKLKIHKLINEGKFGKVFQISLKLSISNKVYAMRTIKKLAFFLNKYSDNDRVIFFKNIEQEREIRLLKCRFIVRTKSIFESKVT
jgi:hypothetical protein